MNSSACVRLGDEAVYQRTCAFSFSLRFICKSQHALCIFFFFPSSEFNSHPRLSHFVSVCARHGQISLLFFSVCLFQAASVPSSFPPLGRPAVLRSWRCWFFCFSVCLVVFFFFFFFKGKIKDTKEIKCKMKVLILHVFTNLDISKLLLLFCSCFWGFVLLIAEKTNWVKWQVQGHRTPVSSQTETVTQRLSQSLNFPRQKGRQICKSLKDLSHRPYVKHVPEF